MTAVNAPVFTDTVDQNFFIEALGGPQQPISYLDRFPDSVYTKALDSVLVTFLYALLGPAGVGSLRQSYLEARLQLEEAGLSAANLDALYTNPFAFARLAEETYDIDASASLLSAQDAATILASDADFRNRAINFLKGIRAGGTLQGLTLVAQSGADRPVEVIENYRSLYDQHSDQPLGLPYMGSTLSLNEVIVLPRQDMPRNNVQSFVIDGEPISGWFTITVPLGPPSQAVLVQSSALGSNIISIPNASQAPTGVYVSITSSTGSSIGAATPTVYAEANITQDDTDIALVYPPYSPMAGQALSPALTDNTLYWAYIGHTETIPLPYDADAPTVSKALQSLPVIGGNNVIVSGGPLPDQAITITFINDLADADIPTIRINTNSGTPSGIPSEMADASGESVGIVPQVTVDVVGVSADGTIAPLSAINNHAMEVALDQIRPMTSLVTVKKAAGVTRRVPANTIFGATTQVEVLRYETGNRHVHWPTVDGVHWIESGREHEAPQPIGTQKYHYHGFHNIHNIYTYTERALNDPHYGGDIPDIWRNYWDTKIGPFSRTQQALYPFLKRYTDATEQFVATNMIAPSPDPLVITGAVHKTNIINNIYPADYLGLHGVPPLPKTKTFWASTERAPQGANPSIDYIEIDLGHTQAVNYLYFEATNKPYLISVAYDSLDQGNNRRFVPVTIMPPALAKSTTSLSYRHSITNPWTTAELHFTNSLNQMIFTRYIRLAFQRNPTHSPFAPTGASLIPYSIEVRNLRIGRNLSSPLHRTVVDTPFQSPPSVQMIGPTGVDGILLIHR